MAGVGVQEKKIVTVTTTDGMEIERGDILCLSIKGQDIVCRFCEIDGNSYFVTTPVISDGGKKEVKYRLQSIATCFKVKSFEVFKAFKVMSFEGFKEDEALKEAAQDAADHADQDTLAPAAE